MPKPLTDGWLSEQAMDDMVERMSPEDKWSEFDPVCNELLRKELREVAAAALEWAAQHSLDAIIGHTSTEEHDTSLRTSADVFCTRAKEIRDA